MNINIENIVSPLVTILVGGIAIYLYVKQRKDLKKDTANTIFLEITNAERKLKLAKEQLSKSILAEDIFTMESESWSKYNYLFVRDFDRDEWDIITDFYNKCKQYDQAVLYNNSFFQRNEEQIRVNIQRILADFAKVLTENEKEESRQSKFDQMAEIFKTIYMKKPELYYPNKPVTDAKKSIDALNVNLSVSSIGSKLKKLAGINE